MLRILTATVFLASAFFSGAPEAVHAEVVERIVAVVNDEIITEQDLQVVMAPVAAQLRTRFTGPELDGRLSEMRRDFLNRVIEDKLVLSEAKRRQVIVKDDEVDEMITEVRNKFPSKEIFLQSLEEQGLTERKLWNRFRDQIMTQKFVSYEVKSKVAVSPGEISEYYKNHASEFDQGDRVKLLHILVRIGTRSEEEARTFSESLIQKINTGESFEELAKSYSEGAEAKEGGQMGWIQRGQLMGEIDEKVFALNSNQVAAPIQSSLGFHIFKVLEYQKSSIQPLSEVRDSIFESIFKRKLRMRLESWIENLRKHAYISVH